MTRTGDRHSSLLMIGLDAADSTLIREWMAAGLLPNLSALLSRGGWTTLDPTPDWMVGALWPSFYSSSTVEHFGMYHYLVWRPERMATERPEPQWMPLEPFWRDLPALGRRVIAVDMPLCYPPNNYPGVEVSGWATHEIIQAPNSSPSGLLDEIRGEFGPAPLPEESACQLTVAECLAVRRRERHLLSIAADRDVNRIGHPIAFRPTLQTLPAPLPDSHWFAPPPRR